MRPKVSVIIPNYNEQENIERGVLDQINQYLDKADFTWEVIISDDGSTDNSPSLISSFIKNHKNFYLLKNPHAGKAKALLSGIKKAKGKIVLLTDMDQSTPIKEIEKLLPWYDQGYDIVFGSRGKMRKNFPLTRQITSWGFRNVRQLFLLRSIIDTQCGFKSLTTKNALKIFPQLSIIKNPTAATGWSVTAYDVEMLFIAQKMGLKLKEVDVIWQDEDTSTQKSKNFLTESLDMFKQILQVKLNDKRGQYNF